MFEAFSKLLPKIKKTKPYRPIIATSESGVEVNYTCRVVMLDGGVIFLDIKLSEKGQAALNQVCSKLKLYEKEFFSLKYLENRTQKWLNLSKAINNQLHGAGPHTLFFCVRFYPMGPSRILSETGRYQVYLQIKQDIREGRLLLPDEVSLTFAALSVQADLGNVDVMTLDQDEISMFKPQNTTLDEFKISVQREQKKYENRSSATSEFLFLEQSSWLDHYGVEMHNVKIEDGTLILLGISPTGLLLFSDGERIGAHYWPRLSKISFKNKTLNLKIIITSGGEETRSFESCDKDSCKSLYKSCVEHHAFFKLVTVTNSDQPLNSMKHSNSSSKIFSAGNKTSRSTPSAVIPDVVSGQAYHRFDHYHYHRSQRRSRRSSGSESCPENDGYVQRPSSCAMIGHRGDLISPMSYRSYYGESSMRRNHYPREDGEYLSGSESEATAHDRRFQRGHPIYMTTVEVRRGRSRPIEDVSFYSEVERDQRRKHPKSRARVYPEEPLVGFGDHYYRGDSYHVYDRLPVEEVGGHSQGKGTTIRWADEHARRQEYDRGRLLRTDGQAELRKRYRKRSQSPGCGAKPPQELANHFRYVDQLDSGMAGDLRDIPYTKVETDISSAPIVYSPRTKNKIRMSRRTASHKRQNSDIASISLVVPDGEAPPPYLGAANSPGRHMEALTNRMGRTPSISEEYESRSARSRMHQSDVGSAEEYRRQANLRLSRSTSQMQPSSISYDVDEPESRDKISSRSWLPGLSHAFVDTVENYRREMNIMLSRGCDEAVVGWYAAPIEPPKDN